MAVAKVRLKWPVRRQGVATLLMDAAEQLAGERGVTTLGITVGLFDECGRPSDCTGSGAMSLTAGAHAGPSGRSEKECRSPWTTI